MRAFSGLLTASHIGFLFSTFGRRSDPLRTVALSGHTVELGATVTGVSTGRRRAAALAIALVGAIHLVLAPEYLSKAAYLGVLFVAGAIAAFVVAVRVWTKDDEAAWRLGGLVAAGMFVGFVLSRTTGLPGFHEQEWEPTGLLSLALELWFLAAMPSRLRTPRPLRGS
jgi:hypothetical protein